MFPHLCVHRIYSDMIPGMLLDEETSGVRRFLSLPSKISVPWGEKMLSSSCNECIEDAKLCQGHLTPRDDFPLGRRARAESGRASQQGLGSWGWEWAGRNHSEQRNQGRQCSEGTEDSRASVEQLVVPCRWCTSGAVMSLKMESRGWSHFQEGLVSCIWSRWSWSLWGVLLEWSLWVYGREWMGCEDGGVEKRSCVKKLLNPGVDLRSELRLIELGEEEEGRSREGMVTLRMTPRSLAWVIECTEVPLLMMVNTEDGAARRGRWLIQVWIYVMWGTRGTSRLEIQLTVVPACGSGIQDRGWAGNIGLQVFGVFEVAFEVVSCQGECVEWKKRWRPRWQAEDEQME